LLEQSVPQIAPPEISFQSTHHSRSLHIPGKNSNSRPILGRDQNAKSTRNG
jgi:hypothetical protein